MYLKSIKINNFRKFSIHNNLIKFVDSKQGLSKNNTDVSKATTLIVGKNNSGKTTITKALQYLNLGKFTANDYNFSYLNGLLENYTSDIFENYPGLEFDLIIGLDDSDDNPDLVTNIFPFMNVENAKSSRGSKSQVGGQDTFLFIGCDLESSRGSRHFSFHSSQ